MRNRQTSPVQQFQRADRLHRQGKLDQAGRLYCAILVSQPNHFDTLHRLGVVRYQQGRHTEALGHIGSALKVRPNDVLARSNLGLVQSSMGQHDAAVASYDRALALTPQLADTLNRRGHSLSRLGRLHEALASFEKAIAFNPQFADAMHNLGLALMALNRPSEALNCYDRLLALRPDDVPGLNNRGLALQALGRPEEALGSYRRALVLNPDHLEACNNCGNALRALNRPSEALSCYDRALAVHPASAEALTNRGTALGDLNRHAEALADHDKALACKPDHAEAHNNRGVALRMLDRPDEALSSYKQALAIRPDFADAFDNMGVVLTELGRFAEANDCIECSIAIAPKRVRSYYNLTELRPLRTDEPHLQVMDGLSQDLSSLSADDRIHLHFALAKAWTDIGDYNKAFPLLMIANALKRQQISYDEAATVAGFQRTAAAYTKHLMGPNDGLGELSALPVFILGMPRSGTTLVEQILARHPQVAAGGESEAFSEVIAEMGADAQAALQSPDAASHGVGESLRQLGARYVDRIRAIAPRAQKFTNKSPGNFGLVGLIHLALPNAPIIHTRRDPIDTCVSCFSKLFAGDLPYAYDLAELGRYYRAYDLMMEHWRRAAPQGCVLEVRYEDIVDDLEGQARRIVAHCGLDWDPRCLDFHLAERSVRTASAAQVRQPIYRGSVGRWRLFESFLQPLIAELEPLFSPDAARLKS